MIDLRKGMQGIVVVILLGSASPIFSELDLSTRLVAGSCLGVVTIGLLARGGSWLRRWLPAVVSFGVLLVMFHPVGLNGTETSVPFRPLQVRWELTVIACLFGIITIPALWSTREAGARMRPYEGCLLFGALFALGWSVLVSSLLGRIEPVETFEILVLGIPAAQCALVYIGLSRAIKTWAGSRPAMMGLWAWFFMMVI